MDVIYLVILEEEEKKGWQFVVAFLRIAKT